jgi:hypothetical protein
MDAGVKQNTVRTDFELCIAHRIGFARGKKDLNYFFVVKRVITPGESAPDVAIRAVKADGKSLGIIADAGYRLLLGRAATIGQPEGGQRRHSFPGPASRVGMCIPIGGRMGYDETRYSCHEWDSYFLRRATLRLATWQN